MRERTRNEITFYVSLGIAGMFLISINGGSLLMQGMLLIAVFKITADAFHIRYTGKLIPQLFRRIQRQNKDLLKRIKKVRRQ